jgi:transcriptional regulator with GAF, ATPase, and Fis domain
MDQVIQVVGAERGFLMLKQEHDQELHFAAARGLDQKTIAQPSFAISASLAREVMESGQAILTRDALNDARFHGSDSIQELKLRSILCCPLKIRDRLIGVVYVDNRSLSDKFNQSNLNLLRAVADQAALAIENARLAEKNLQQTRQLKKTAHQLEKRGKDLEKTVSRQKQELANIRHAHDPFHQWVGESRAIKKLKNLVKRIASSDLPVLIEGESGSGKELLAQTLHQIKNQEFPETFEVVNCGSLSPSLLESELFGHVKGAFSGAIRDHQGVFERADGGTLFLDEIGDMPSNMQVKLLRVLENGEVRPVGSSQSIQVNVRIIAATHRHLERDVQEKKFRQDLYFRLSAITVQVPPLRERNEDIQLLFVLFLRFFSEKYSKNLPNVTNSALKALSRYSWPGNIRELKNLAERLVSLGHIQITEKDIPENQADSFPAMNTLTFDHYKKARKNLLDHFDRSIIFQSLEKNQGNVSKAAQSIGIERQYFHKIMKKCGVHSRDFR